ncbi:MAG: DUF1016 N-terminal domain-containing protein [Cyclobacteriaceae bacterium]
MGNLKNKMLLDAIRDLVFASKKRAVKKVNAELIRMNWEIGRLIIDYEQKGEERAAYGEEVLQQISNQLTLEFGKGFDYSNLTNMRKFFLTFPNVDALRQELSWTHFRLLSRVEKETDRHKYMHLAADEDWNTRYLERNIRSGYLGRMLETPEEKSKLSPRTFVKDPYIFEFLGLGKDEKHL